MGIDRRLSLHTCFFLLLCSLSSPLSIPSSFAQPLIGTLLSDFHSNCNVNQVCLSQMNEATWQMLCKLHSNLTFAPALSTPVSPTLLLLHSAGAYRRRLHISLRLRRHAARQRFFFAHCAMAGCTMGEKGSKGDESRWAKWKREEKNTHNK